MNPEAFIQMRQIVKTFKNESGEVTVLKGIDADFNQGEFVSVVGKSGSGKSTLINMLTGIDHPTSGSVRVAGSFIHTMNESQMSIWRGRNLGIVFQFFQLLPMLSLAENVMLPMDFCDLYSYGEREQRALQLLDLVNLADFSEKLPSDISGGQQACCAIARALATDPPILIADEPTGNLDSNTAEQIMRLFKQQVEHGKTFIMVTHDNSLAQQAQRTLLICDGELVNEAVWHAWPDLTHDQMLSISHLGKRRMLNSGETLIENGTIIQDFYLIGRGGVRMILYRNQEVVDLGPGQYFGEVDLLHGSCSKTKICACDQGAELLVFDRQAFTTLLAFSPIVAKQVATPMNTIGNDHHSFI